MMIGVRKAFLFILLGSAALAQTPAASQNDSEAPKAPPIARSLDLSTIDKSADPCTDFYQYSCGNWIKDNPVPADQVRWVRSFSLLQERNLYELRQELAKAATKPAGPLEERYGDFFAACMDVAELEKKGLASLKPALERISALNDSKGIAALIGDLVTAGDPAPLRWFEYRFHSMLVDLCEIRWSGTISDIGMRSKYRYSGPESYFCTLRDIEVLQLCRMNFLTKRGSTFSSFDRERPPWALLSSH